MTIDKCTGIVLLGLTLSKLFGGVTAVVIVNKKKMPALSDGDDKDTI